MFRKFFRKLKQNQYTAVKIIDGLFLGDEFALKVLNILFKLNLKKINS